MLRSAPIAPFIPMKKENSTCEIAFAALGTLFLCCVRVVNQNTVALLLLVFCYSYATWHVLVTHLTTYTQHENREAKEKRQDRRILQSRTYALPFGPPPPCTQYDVSCFPETRVWISNSMTKNWIYFPRAWPPYLQLRSEKHYHTRGARIEHRDPTTYFLLKHRRGKIFKSQAFSSTFYAVHKGIVALSIFTIPLVINLWNFQKTN